MQTKLLKIIRIRYQILNTKNIFFNSWTTLRWCKLCIIAKAFLIVYMVKNEKHLMN